MPTDWHSLPGHPPANNKASLPATPSLMTKRLVARWERSTSRGRGAPEAQAQGMTEGDVTHILTPTRARMDGCEERRRRRVRARAPAA